MKADLRLASLTAAVWRNSGTLCPSKGVLRYLLSICPWSVVRGPWSVVRGPWSAVRSGTSNLHRPSRTRLTASPFSRSSRLPSVAALKVDHEPVVKVEFDRLELLAFLRADFGPMNAMCERGAMFERLIYERTKAVFGYFELPFKGIGDVNQRPKNS